MSAHEPPAGMAAATILWRRLDQPGHETARLFRLPSGWVLSGGAVFGHNNLACKLDYLIQCDSSWRTLSAQVAGWVGGETIDLNLEVGPDQRWTVNQVEITEVEGCIDLDLNFSPSTNLLPIRRLLLAGGEAREVKAAWLRFPSFKLEPLQQVYRRLDATTFRYESAGGQFVTELKVNELGFVTEYPGIWIVEAGDG